MSAVTSCHRPAARQPPRVDPDAEYQAAKRQYVAALARLKAAKAAVALVEQARYEAKKQEQMARIIKAAEAFVGGASYKHVATMAGKSPTYTDFRYLFSPFWHMWLTSDEIWEDGDRRDSAEDFREWERRTTERALFHYRKGTER